MCGIAGALGGGYTLDQATRIATGMAVAIAHRGPDGQGVWADAEAGILLAHRRLAIVDLSPAGAQPFISRCGRYVLTYNGEIYNHLDVRSELEKARPDISWVGRSDTETLVETIAAWGLEAALSKCRGMFALALWDRRDRTLALSRDRLGEKPLYYFKGSSGLIFGSELAALEAHPEFRSSVDPVAVAHLLKRHYVPAPLSIYKDVRKVLPGRILYFGADATLLSDAPYWTLAAAMEPGDRTSVDDIEALLTSAVGEQLVADVPVGVFLSGGVDSSLIALLAQRTSTSRIKTFCAQFTDSAFDESAHAHLVAQAIGSEHHTLAIENHDLPTLVSNMGSIFSEPFADASQIPTYLISQAARGNVTVALSGDGGDELFMGYRRHRLASQLGGVLPAMPQWAKDAAGRMAPAAGRLPGGGGVVRGQLLDRLEKTASILRSRDLEDLFDRLTSPGTVDGLSSVAVSDALPGGWAGLPRSASHAETLSWIDMASFLPDDVLTKVDRAAMAVGLETRAPFLDQRVVEAAIRLPVNDKLAGGRQKLALRSMLDRHMPPGLMERPKQGFSPPLGAWLRTVLRDWADDTLSRDNLDPGLFDRDKVADLWSRHRSGERNLQYVLWPVLMYQSWSDARR